MGEEKKKHTHNSTKHFSHSRVREKTLQIIKKKKEGGIHFGMRGFSGGYQRAMCTHTRRHAGAVKHFSVVCGQRIKEDLHFVILKSPPHTLS